MNIEQMVRDVKAELQMYEGGAVRLMPSRCEHGVPMHKDCDDCYQKAIE